jgi:hypothetical protein
VNPPESKGPLYDLGYADGYRDCRIWQAWLYLEALSVDELEAIKQMQEKDSLLKVVDRS